MGQIKEKKFELAAIAGATLMRYQCKLDKLCQSSRKRRIGVAVVEFVVVAPVFLLFVLENSTEGVKQRKV